MYGWTAERLVRKQAEIGQPSYLYLWDHGYPAADDAGLHGFHGGELPYVFGTMRSTPPLWPKIPGSAAENRLSDAMTDYWVSFAKTGKPQSAKGPAWPAFGTGHIYMHIEQQPKAGTRMMPGMYELNEEVVCRRRAASTQPWNWNVGLASPKMPAAAKACGR